jgi:hypothetical protein
MTLRQKWIKALRSKRYKQGQGELAIKLSRNRGEKNCCLGVVCRVARLDQKGVAWRGNSTLSDLDAYEHGIDGYKLLDELGLSPSQETKLIQMNDGYGDLHEHSFEEIADWLEAQDAA